MTLGLVESMSLDRVNFRLALRVRKHPASEEVVVEQYPALRPMLARYDALVAEER
jgi:hypothetical protein